jgi:NCAIR mutase (PurE)-related protein
VTSEDKTNTYDDTVNRTTSEPTADVTVSEETAITTVSPGEVETYEVQSETTTTSEEESVSTKARDAGRSLKDLIYSLGKKTKEVTEEKAKELKAQSVDISTRTDARDIQNLGDDVEKLITVFEDTMTEIRKESYDEQEKLLVGYKKLLQEQIIVIDARLSMAKRLKPGA